MSQPAQLPPERKALYYAGIVVMLAGIALFVSNFFVVAQGPSMPWGHNPMPGMVGRGLGGMALIAVGGLLRNVGARGAAGSGLILDPEQAREDLKPWAQTAGGLVKDALEEVRGPAETPEEPEPEPVVKVRCTACRTLNDEDARFCKQCGAAM